MNHSERYQPAQSEPMNLNHPIEFADPINARYPIDTADHVLNAWHELHDKNSVAVYSTGDLLLMRQRVKRAATQHGLEIAR